MTLSNRFDFQFYHQGKHGGMTIYPFSGITEGVKVSYASAAGTTINLDVTAGQAYLDSVLVDVPALSFSVEAPADVTVDGNDYEFGVYLNPTREVKAYTEADIPGSADDGTVIVVVYGGPDGTQMADRFLERKNGAWVNYVAIQAPPDYQHNNMPLHKVLNEVSADNLSSELEPVIFHNTVAPLYVYSQAHAYFRKSGSIKIADVSVVAGVTPEVTVYTYEGDKRAGI